MSEWSRTASPAGSIRVPSFNAPYQARSNLRLLLMRRRISLAIFLCLVLPLGIILAIVTPLGGVADETAHALRAESLSQGQIIAHRAPIRLPDGSERMAAGVEADAGLRNAMEIDGPGDLVTRQRQSLSGAATWQHMRSFAEITPLALYMPIFYVPAAAAIAVLREGGAGPATAILGGRLANLVVYALLGTLALLLARRGHALLLCTLAFPMEVSLAASLNQDGLLVATAVLAAALLTRDAMTTSNAGAIGWRPSRTWLVAAGLLGLVTLVKIPYGGLLLLLILPLHPLSWGTARRAAIAAAVALPAFLWTGYAMSHISVPWPPLPIYAPGPLWPGPQVMRFSSPDAIAQMQVLRADPWRVITLTIHSILMKKSILLELVGVLGFLNVHLPYWFYAVWGAALVIGGLAADNPSEDRSLWHPIDAVAVGLMLMLTIIAIYMSQYLTWTPVGMTEVIGPSGRYLLPLLPSVIWLLPRLRLSVNRDARTALCFLPIATASSISLFVVPLHVHQVFFGP